MYNVFFAIDLKAHYQFKNSQKFSLFFSNSMNIMKADFDTSSLDLEFAMVYGRNYSSEVLYFYNPNIFVQNPSKSQDCSTDAS